MDANPQFVMNSDTREVYPYSEALLKVPGFVPFSGPLPPIDRATGSRLLKDEFIIKTTSVENLDYSPKTPEERIERIASVIKLVPEEEVTEKGKAGIVALEKLVGFRITVQERDKAYAKLAEERKARETAKAEANSSKE